MLKNIAEQNYHLIIDQCLNEGSVRGLCIALIAYTGARANEVLRLTHESIDINESSQGIDSVNVSIKASKRGINRDMALGAKLYARVKIIREVLKERKCNLARLVNESSWSVQTAYENLRLYFNRIQKQLMGEQKHTSHSFRHTLAIKAFKKSYDIIKVKKMLGHKSLNATQYYLSSYESSIVLNNVHLLVEETEVS